MMKISITGSTGFIGKNLLKQLTEKRIAIRTLVRSHSQSISEHSKTEVVLGDIRDEKSLDALVKDCECLIHLANVYQTKVSSLKEMYAINVDASKKLFEKAVAQGVKRIVYMSSAGVHQHRKGIIDELVPLRTDSDDPYEIQKIACEQFLRELALNHPVETVIIRPATVYGPGDWRLIPLFKMIRSGRFFFIGSGDNHVSWVYIDDLIRAIEIAIEHPNAVGQSYIITGPDTITLKQLVNVISQILQVKPPQFKLPLFPFLMAAAICETIFPILGIRPPITKARLRFFTDNLRYSSEKIKKELNVELDTSLKDGLRKTLISIGYNLTQEEGQS